MTIKDHVEDWMRRDLEATAKRWEYLAQLVKQGKFPPKPNPEWAKHWHIKSWKARHETQQDHQ